LCSAKHENLNFHAHSLQALTKGMVISMQENELKVPEHIAIIMDGNGRWAKKKKMPRNYGHTQGSKVVEKICEEAYNIGVKYLTIYAFSTENWIRPKEEVDALMKLLQTYLSTSVKTSNKNNMRVRVIGDKSGLSENIIKSINNLEEATKNNTGLNFQVAINYGGRNEIIRAAKSLSLDVKKNITSIDDIDEAVFEQYLDTEGIPDPDLMIRTSGEQRLSNYLLWQLAYTEFYFTEVLWPDFNKAELLKAIEYYNSRNRNFGGVF
jgi:undecaprenyl diphosphate synthase